MANHYDEFYRFSEEDREQAERYQALAEEECFYNSDIDEELELDAYLAQLAEYRKKFSEALKDSPAHYYDLIDEKENMEEQDIDEKIYSVLEAYDPDEDYPEENVGKRKAGKAAGARYFFLRELANADSQVLAYYLYYLIVANDTGLLEDCIDYAYFVLEELKDYMDDAIKIRAQAIDSGKYSIHSYESLTLDDRADILDALARHFIKAMISNKPDEESGYSHQGHMINNLLILIHIYKGAE